jgi:hypothetical protein
LAVFGTRPAGPNTDDRSAIADHVRGKTAQLSYSVDIGTMLRASLGEIVALFASHGDRLLDDGGVVGRRLWAYAPDVHGAECRRGLRLAEATRHARSFAWEKSC